MRTWLMFALFLQKSHRYSSLSGLLTAINPQVVQINCFESSDTSCILSFRKQEEPCATIASLSISPRRKPPALERPSDGCLVSQTTGPVLPRLCILSNVICLSL